MGTPVLAQSVFDYAFVVCVGLRWGRRVDAIVYTFSDRHQGEAVFLSL